MREKVRAVFKKEWVKLAEQNSRGGELETLKCADELARDFMMRRRVLTELIFAIQIGITFILAVVIYYMASEALAGRERWVLFIAYIAALRMTLTGIAQPIRAFAAVSRFYPQIVRYYLFARDMEKIDSARFASVEAGATVILGSLPNGVEVTVKAGEDCVAVVTYEPLRDVQLALLDAKLPTSTGSVGDCDCRSRQRLAERRVDSPCWMRRSSTKMQIFRRQGRRETRLRSLFTRKLQRRARSERIGC